MGQKSNAHKGKNAPTTCSPSVGIGKKSDTAGSVASSRCVGCVGCGVNIQNETRALQCDKCIKDKWKCIECLGMPAEVYDGLIDCKDIFWFRIKFMGQYGRTPPATAGLLVRKGALSGG